MGKWKGVVLDRRKGQKIELYDLSAEESEQKDLATEFPEVVERIRNAMNAAHEPNPFWSKDNKPLCDAKAACAITGEKFIPKKKKGK